MSFAFPDAEVPSEYVISFPDFHARMWQKKNIKIKQNL